MITTALHISDLHRDSGSAITTDSLLESLRRDRERYTKHGIPAPDLAVVSGDIVYGVTSDGPDADSLLKAQYLEATTFLTELADMFFRGNRERVILVPGNHDISHPHVLRATEATPIPVEATQRALLASQLAEDSSTWRWVASDFALRRLVDQDIYRRRMEPYAEFYAGFYAGKRSFSLDPSKQFAMHDFADLGVVVAALSSCCDNDLFNRAGRIHPDCVAGATRAVAEHVKSGRVALAVWHHNLAGGPKDNDYVDADVLQSLIDGGFVVGLHGHQHRPQFLQHRFTADRKMAISVVSAGTLCGGPKTLPSGRMRSYNLIVLDAEQRTGTVHVRDMKNSGFGLPVWGEAYVDEFSGPSMTFGIEIPLRPASVLQAIAEAADLMQRGELAEAYKLALLHPEDGVARRVAVEALTRLEDWEEIQKFCSPPRSAPEFIALAGALYEAGKKPALATLLKSDYARESTDAGVRQAIDLANSRLGGR
jgi:3',5'-cyclic AMP phosphodiesterase CpdA